MFTLESYQKVSIFLLLILSIFQCVGIFLGWWAVTDVLSIVPEFIFVAIIGIFFWAFLKNIEHRLGKTTSTTVNIIPDLHYNPIYSNLAVYYHRISGLPDSPEYAQLKYVIDNTKKMAYRIRKFPEWFELPIKEHELEWKSYDDERVLKRYIKENYFITNQELSPEIIGLKYKNGRLIEDAKYSEILSKLEEAKLGENQLETLQIVELTRGFFFKHVRRILLVDFTAKKVWLAPAYWSQLVDMDLINHEVYSMHFWESCKRWVKRVFDFELVPNQYPESQLIAKATNKNGK